MTTTLPASVATASEQLTPDDFLAEDLGIPLRELRRTVRIHEEELTRWGALDKKRARIAGTTQFATQYAFNAPQAELLALLSDCEAGQEARDEIITERARIGHLNWEDRRGREAELAASLRVRAAELLATAQDYEAIAARKQPDATTTPAL